MRTSLSVALGALSAVALAAGLPALGQDTPESILPPGFNDPVATPTPAPSAASPRPAPMGTPATGMPGLPLPAPAGSPTPVAGATPAAPPMRYQVPEYARHSLAIVGAAGPGEGALAADAFGRADGRYLEALMRRLDAPIASRWLSIALRRALIARVATPAHVDGADFAAERGWLLVRMGEAVAARAVVQDVDAGHYTPKLFQVAMQAALATGDPGALCPAAEAGAQLRHERAWVLARGMCVGLSGLSPTPLLNAAEHDHIARGIDLLLARKVAGVGSKRQAITIEWDDVDRLTIWRYGLATATGVEIPAALIAAAGPQVQSWRALSPALAAHDRAAAAEQAAVRGVFSNAALVDLYSSVDDDDDQSLAESGIARDLRGAYVAPTIAGRLAALKQLWDEPKTADGRFGRLVLTAHAAARVPVDAENADGDRLVAAMLTAGLDRTALRWRGQVARGGDGWAMLALADPDSGSTYSYADIGGYAGRDPDGLKRRMLFAGLAGLGRMSEAEITRGATALDVPVGAANAWTHAIDRAARLRQPGTVLLLAGIGMQTAQWRGVPAEVLYHSVVALRQVGLPGEARMIAAEAIARL